MYSIEFSKTAGEQFDKLPIDLQDRIINSLERIRIRPHYFIKKLVGVKYFSLRVGEYRIILDINNQKFVILVIELGHRRNIYK